MTLARAALCVLTVAGALQVNVAYAGEMRYRCPAEILVHSGQVKAAESYTPWVDPQAKKRFIGIALYDGPPSEMADLEPDNGDDVNAKGNVWSVSDNPRGYWMVCLYANTDVRFTRRIETPKKTCHTKNGDSTSPELICE